jgi:hypothetical protein
MLLGPNEHLVREEAAELGLGTERVRGTLVLTDQRVVFVARNAAGLFTPGTSRTLVNLDVHQLTAVFVDRPKLRLGSADRGIVTVEAGGHAAQFRVRGAGSWRDSILRVRPTLLPLPPHPPPPPPSPARDGASLPGEHGKVVHTIEREVVLIRCRFCHTAVPERSGKCPHCGAPL